MFFLFNFIVFIFFNTALAMWPNIDDMPLVDREESYDLSSFDSSPRHQNSPFVSAGDNSHSHSETASSNRIPNIPGEMAQNLGGIGNQATTAQKPIGLTFHTMSAEQVKNIKKSIKFHIVSAEEASGNKAATKTHTRSQEQASGFMGPAAFHLVSPKEAAGAKSGITPRSFSNTVFRAQKRPSNETMQPLSKKLRTTSYTNTPIDDVDDEDYWFCPSCGVGMQRNSTLYITHQNACSFKLKTPGALPSLNNNAQAFSNGFNVLSPQVSSLPEQFPTMSKNEWASGNTSSLEEEHTQQSSSHSQTTPTSLFSPVPSPILFSPAPSQGAMNFPQEIQQENRPEVDVDLSGGQRINNEQVLGLPTSEPPIGAEDNLAGGAPALFVPQVEEQLEVAPSILSGSLICGYPTKESADGISAPCSQSFSHQDERAQHIGEFHIRTCHWFICPHGQWEKCLEGPFANVDALKKHVLNKHIQCSSKNIHH